MKEFLEGRRLGFAPRPLLATATLGVGIATLLLDLMAWFAWGARDTNGFVVAAYFLAIATAVVGLVALLTAVAEYRDVPDEERGVGRLDLAAGAFVVILYAASATLRAADLGAVGASPAALLLEVAGLIVQTADVAIAGNLYAAREWEELEEEPARHRGSQRRRVPAAR